jgi:phosphoglycolate phosphatase-like HAD superfamily hydrolase
MTTLKDVQTIVWDLDGTLLDSFGIHVDIMTQVLMKYGRPEPTYDQLRHNFYGKLEESMRGLAGKHTSDTELAAMLEDFLKIDNEYIKEVDRHLFVDAIGLAKQAHTKGVRQIFVTNRAHGSDRGNASPRNIIENSSLKGLITEVFCGDEVRIRKPDPMVLESVIEELNPGMTLMIGDQAVDAVFAHNFGARAVLVNRFDDEIHHLDNYYREGGRDTHLVRVGALSDVTIA